MSTKNINMEMKIMNKLLVKPMDCRANARNDSHCEELADKQSMVYKKSNTKVEQNTRRSKCL